MGCRTPSTSVLVPMLWAAALATGCNFGNQDALESPLEVGAIVAAGDPTQALFTINEAFGTLVRIRPDGSWDYSDLGGKPTALTVASDGRTLLAIDQLSSEVLLLDANGASLSPTRLPVGQGHNTIIVDPTQPYAVTFLDISKTPEIDFDGTLSLNEIHVIDLSTNPPTSTPVIVAFNPRDVVFSPGGDLAVVLSERRASFVPLANPPQDPDTVRLDISATEVAPPEDVVVRPRLTQDPNDMSYALIARRGSGEMFAIAIEDGDGTINVIDLGIVPTDLVTTADGNYAVAISRGRDLVSVIRLDPFGEFDTSDVFLVATPSIVGDAVVAPADGDPEHDRRVLLFDAQGNLEELMTLDAETLDVRQIRLVNPPTRVVAGPEGQAVALHKRFPTSPSASDLDAWFDSHDSFSLIDLDKRTAEATTVESIPRDALFAPSAGLHRVFITVPETGHLAYAQTDVGTSDAEKIGAGPERLGSLNDGTIYAVHAHAFGLVTFINPSDLSRTTARGFLAAGALD